MKIKTSTIDEMCHVEYGTRVTRKKDSRDSGKIYPVYGGGGETFFIDKINRKNRTVIARFAMSKNCTRFVKGNFFLNDSGLTLSPKTTELSQEYLDKIILASNNLIYQLGRGAAQRNLDMKRFRMLKISFPTSLHEQQRIVAKLDAAFVEIDESIIVTKKYLHNSKKLFLNYLDSLVNEPNLGKKLSLGEVCTLSQGLAINKFTKHLLVNKSKKPLIRIKDLISNTVQQYIDDRYENKKTSIKKEDLIFTRTGSLGLVFRGREGILHNNSFKIEPSNLLSKDYMYWWLQNPSFLKKIHLVAAKAAQPDISHKLFNSMPIIVPLPQKQKEILGYIEKFKFYTKELTEAYQNKLVNIIKLKQSILKQKLNTELKKAS